jgi:hypothetical protein
MTTYDYWKTTEADPHPYCDCCGKRRPVTRVWYCGLETYACARCRRDPDEAREQQHDNAGWYEE